ncbi:hypothetical protein B0H17DRAFT_355998 [Mycena rosella]|uniref:Uncharacterized protein n=1 Tax=Mycena rosella TaxID=1033263 RepID=A0AAD7DTF0_MYCRO|nr:hypothetical protein B0H17DRAFT_355998 [Mycena rosella]
MIPRAFIVLFVWTQSIVPPQKKGRNYSQWRLAYFCRGAVQIHAWHRRLCFSTQPNNRCCYPKNASVCSFDLPQRVNNKKDRKSGNLASSYRRLWEAPAGFGPAALTDSGFCASRVISAATMLIRPLIDPFVLAQSIGSLKRK